MSESSKTFEVTAARLAQVIGHRVWEIRREQGLTQMKLAERIKCSVQYIGSIERGAEKNLQLATLAKLVNALQIPIEELFKEPKDPRPRHFGRPTTKRG